MAGRGEQGDTSSFHDEPCIICKGLKNFQSDRMYVLNRQAFPRLCNLHTWLLAKTAEAGVAAEVLFGMLEYALKEERTRNDCGMCALIAKEEERRLEDFGQNLRRPEALLHLGQRGGLCIPHARKLLEQAPDSLRNEIISALQKRVVELKRELAILSRSARSGETIHPGLLGRAAEFLVSNRGLDTKR